MSTILGFSGKIGSGKTSLSIEVAKALGWPRASFGDYVRHLAATKGLDNSRPALQKLGTSLIDSGWTPFCTAVIGHSEWRAGDSLVVDGIRHAEALDVLKSLTAASKVLLVHVQISEAGRQERLVERDGLLGGSDAATEDHETESQSQTILPCLSDLVVDASDALDGLRERVVRWVLALE